MFLVICLCSGVVLGAARCRRKDVARSLPFRRHAIRFKATTDHPTWATNTEKGGFSWAPGGYLTYLEGKLRRCQADLRKARDAFKADANELTEYDLFDAVADFNSVDNELAEVRRDTLDTDYSQLVHLDTKLHDVKY